MEHNSNHLASNSSSTSANWKRNWTITWKQIPQTCRWKDNENIRSVAPAAKLSRTFCGGRFECRCSVHQPKVAWAQCGIARYQALGRSPSKQLGNNDINRRGPRPATPPQKKKHLVTFCFFIFNSSVALAYSYQLELPSRARARNILERSCWNIDSWPARKDRLGQNPSNSSHYESCEPPNNNKHKFISKWYHNRKKTVVSC